jgi:hypothetical protein
VSTHTQKGVGQAQCRNLSRSGGKSFLYQCDVAVRSQLWQILMTEPLDCHCHPNVEFCWTTAQ